MHVGIASALSVCEVNVGVAEAWGDGVDTLERGGYCRGASFVCASCSSKKSDSVLIVDTSENDGSRIGDIVESRRRG